MGSYAKRAVNALKSQVLKQKRCNPHKHWDTPISLYSVTENAKPVMDHIAKHFPDLIIRQQHKILLPP